MSKRGTSDEHVSKEQFLYDHSGNGDNEGEENAVFGQFRQASSDEMAKRVIKQPRSRLTKMNSGLSDDGTNRSNPFANIMGAKPEPNPAGSSGFTTSITTSAPSPAKPNPFAAFSFPTASTPFTSSSITTATSSTPTAVPATSKFSFTSTSFTPTPAAASSSAPKSTTSITVKPVGSSREDYERSLEALNTTFVRKITKEIEKNPIANLAQVFSQYVDQRTKVKARFNEGTGEPATKMKRKEPFTVATDDKPSFSTSTTNGAFPTSGSAPSTSSFSFSAPASKESDAASKPAISSFNFGVKADTTPASSTTTPAPLFGSFGGFGAKPMTTTGSSTFSFGAPTGSTATSITSVPSNSAASTTTGAPSTPFSFNPPKPFSFNTAVSTSSTTTVPGSTASTGSSAAKPFSFQVPTQLATGSSGTPEAEDDKMPDDTKSNMVDNREGEEGESTVFEVRAKLYAFEGSEHKDLGVGQFRVNEVEASKKRRMIMRNGTGMLTLNSWIIQGMPAKREKNTVTVFALADGKPKRYALRVKTEDSAKELEAALAAGQTGGDKAEDEGK